MTDWLQHAGRRRTPGDFRAVLFPRPTAEEVAERERHMWECRHMWYCELHGWVHIVAPDNGFAWAGGPHCEVCGDRYLDLIDIDHRPDTVPLNPPCMVYVWGGWDIESA